jgi:cobyrinic acid a,c-diamide synthase
VANRVASQRHGDLLKMNIQGNTPVALLKRNADVSLPSRHLGLQLAEEISGIDQQLDLLADALSDTWLAKLPKPVKFSIPKNKSQTPAALLQNTTIAVARDRAFCFLYEQNLNCLRMLGANLVFFSPLEDKHLPEVDAIYLPGGYPELYAKQLAENLILKKDIVDHAAKSKPILAECGGMLFLSEALVDSTGEQYKMLNIMPSIVTMKTKLTAIGSQQVLIDQQEICGHTFHYSSLENSMPIFSQAKYADGRIGEAVYRLNRVTASYLHLYFPSNPKLTAELFLTN